MQPTIDTDESGARRRPPYGEPVLRHPKTPLWRQPRAVCRRVRLFLYAIQDRDYLDAKAADFNGFTCLALLVTALFLACVNVWDYAIDPVNHGQVIGLRLFESAAVVLWALASWRDVHTPAARAAAFVVPLVVEATFLQVLAILDQGAFYGMGGFLYFFVFVPFLVMAQPFLFAVAVLAAITVFPVVVAPLGLSAGLDWAIYNAYMWMAFVPVVCILLLFEHLYWNVFRYRRKLEIQAVTDGLTGLPNRGHFLVAATHSLERHRRNRRPASLLFIDIDRFKAINDGHGHRAGDAALRHVVNRLRALQRAGDLMARYGGEEFAVLLPETGGSAAARIAERMRSAVAATPCKFAAHGSGNARLTISIGIAVARYEPPGECATDINALIDRADRALYEAKRRGRDRIVRADSAAPRNDVQMSPKAWPAAP